MGFLHTVDARYKITFNEQDKSACFQAIHGQDLSMAAGKDERDYQSIDPRRIGGPIPFQCRVANCGTCWIGVLGGKEKLSEISPFEKERLKYFGYDFGNSEQETHPPHPSGLPVQMFGATFPSPSPPGMEFSTSGDSAARRSQKTWMYLKRGMNPSRLKARSSRSRRASGLWKRNPIP